MQINHACTALAAFTASCATNAANGSANGTWLCILLAAHACVRRWQHMLMCVASSTCTYRQLAAHASSTRMHAFSHSTGPCHRLASHALPSRNHAPLCMCKPFSSLPSIHPAHSFFTLVQKL
eukprot:354109-Chlamydomonas_euryale.AAC.6